MKLNLNRTWLFGLLATSMGLAGALPGVAFAQVTAPSALGTTGSGSSSTDVIRVGQVETNGAGCPGREAVTVRPLDGGRFRIDVDFTGAANTGAAGTVTAASTGLRAQGRNNQSTCTVAIQLLGRAEPAAAMELSILRGVATVRSLNTGNQGQLGLTTRLRLANDLSDVARVQVTSPGGMAAATGTMATATAQTQTINLNNLMARAPASRAFVLLVAVRADTRNAANAANLSVDRLTLEGQVGRVAAAAPAPAPVAVPAPAPAPVAAPAPAPVAPPRAPAPPPAAPTPMAMPAPAAPAPGGPPLPPRPTIDGPNRPI